MVKLNTRKKRNAEQDDAHLPLLFTRDPAQDRAAWVRKTFPAAPAMPPEEAIRRWLGETNKPAAVTGEAPSTNAEGPPPFAPKSEPQDDGHREVAGSSNGYPTVQQIAETVAAAVTAALRNHQPRGEPGYVSSPNPPTQPDGAFPSVADSMEIEDVSTATARTVHPDAHSAGTNGRTTAAEYPAPISTGLKLKLQDLSADEQPQVALNSPEDDLVSLLMRGLYSSSKGNGLYLYESEEAHISRRDPSPEPQCEPMAVRLAVAANDSRRAPPPEPVAQPKAQPQGKEITATQSVRRLWDTYKADLCLGTSLVILLVVIFRSIR